MTVLSARKFFEPRSESRPDLDEDYKGLMTRTARYRRRIEAQRQLKLFSLAMGSVAFVLLLLNTL